MTSTFMAELRIIMLMAALVSLGVAQEPQRSARDWFQEGSRLLAAGSYSEAITAYEKSLDLDRTHAETFYMIGTAERRLQHFAQAEAAFSAGIKISPSDARGRIALCQVLTDENKHSAAISQCEAAVKLAPDDPFAEVALLAAMIVAGRPSTEIEPMLESAVVRFPGDNATVETAAEYYLDRKLPARAVPLLETLTTRDPKQVRYFGMLSEAYLRTHRDAEALAAARAATRLDPTSAYSQASLGSIFFELGQNEEAVGLLSKISSANPYFYAARHSLGTAYVRLGRNSQAADVLASLHAAVPDDANIAAELGSVLLRLRRPADAEAIFLKLAERFPSDPDVLLGLAGSYFDRSQYDKAVPIYDKLLSLNPNQGMYQSLLRASRARIGYVSRLSQLSDDAKEHPSDVAALFAWAHALAFAGKTQEAAQAYERVLQLDPPDPKLYVRIAVSFEEMYMDDLAISALRRSISKGETPDAYANLGFIFEHRGEFNKAAEAYSKCIQLKPDVPNIIKVYADLLRANGHRAEALTMYKKSLSLDPSNVASLFQAGVLSAKLGDPASAESYRSTLANLDPQLASCLERFLALKLWQ